MLGTRTKQISAYGRRGHRIINTYDDQGHIHLPTTSDTASAVFTDTTVSLASPLKKRRQNHHVVLSPSPSPRTHHVQKKSPAFKRFKKAAPHNRQEDANSASVAFNGPKEFRPGEGQPVRQPLGVLPSNAPTSPARAGKKGKTTVHGLLPLKNSSSVIDVDIVTFDRSGRRVSQEKRVSKSDVQVNPVQSARVGHPVGRIPRPEKDVIVVSDSEDDAPIVRPPKRANTRARPRPIILSSDDSDNETEPNGPPAGRFRSPIPAPSFSRNVIASPSSGSTPPPSTHPGRIAANKTAAVVPHSVSQPPAKPFQPVALPYHLDGPSRSKPRQLTPIRKRKGRSAAFPAPPSPPSPTTPTDLDLSFSFDELTLSPSTRAHLQAHETAPPAYLVPLLQECSQTTPHEFSAFIDMFPFDPIVQSTHIEDEAENIGLARFQKIGEASFSEVFGIGDVVLKVVPLRDENASGVDVGGELPAPSDAKDVLNEIIMTRAMGETCEGFVKLLRTYIVRGKYPSLLLDLWDEYDERKGSESVRPDGFPVSQVYAIIVLPNGGPDLEAFSFSSSSQTRWRKACSIFWQVTRALAEAEDLVRFEHRDLHWGQILVKTIPTFKQPKISNGKKLSMDHAVYGVKATVIDLGLARMDADDGAQVSTRWTPFEPEIFEGEGDYQFDVYRMMKVCNRDLWEAYHPLTNVMWLHYLLTKLLHAKRIRAPAVSRKGTTSTTFSEMDCYQCLVEVEATLAAAVAGCKPHSVARKGRRKTQAAARAIPPEPAVAIQSASEVLDLGIENGWIS
ncbi:hypothetical protein BXZ70DRAFT_339376 [Cristinia sonorae]|uniref:non-specific serine/threonine protein kinase n=1 Tax=Cristinia sonorae TaxID=1940300 RepID=A0A8K0XN68_9AGAR|nr:hypothetical protein BXZ70DRAFT_339376 [Cristinia sonorae]